MKAAQIDEYGAAQNIVIRELPTPQPTADQVLLRVHAASLNPFDSKLRSGTFRDSISLNFPFTPGGDVAGIIEAVGENVSSLQVGDKVFGQAASISGGSGSFAELATAKPAQLALAPQSVPLTESASLPLVGASALQALTEHINIQSGQRLFINGGAGGIGLIAIQLAKHLGAYVATTATGNGSLRATECGADEVIDYRQEHFYERLQGFDAVFDTVGAEFEKSLTILKPGGIAVSMVASVDDSTTVPDNVQAMTQSTHITTEKLQQLARFVDEGVIQPHIGSVYPLEQVSEAFVAMETGTATGKIVLTMA